LSTPVLWLQEPFNATRSVRSSGSPPGQGSSDHFGTIEFIVAMPVYWWYGADADRASRLIVAPAHTLI
jgi:hypothetical protein